MLEPAEPFSDLTFVPLPNAYQVGLVYDNAFHGWQGPYFRTWARLRKKAQQQIFSNTKRTAQWFSAIVFELQTACAC
jgi:hypothetical protein